MPEQIDIRLGSPMPAAVAALGRRTVVGSPMRTADWDQVDPEIREAAFFSAAVEETRWLESAKAKIDERIALKSASMGRATMDKAKFVREMQILAEQLGMRPAEKQDGRGSLTDPGSRRRLELIFDVQTGLAQGKARWLADVDPDVIKAYPAFEFVRLSPRDQWRDWPQRWKDAGLPDPVLTGGDYGMRMIALKSDPNWSKLSRFGLPFAPFDFQSGMGLKSIGRREAEQAGLLEAGKPPAVPEIPSIAAPGPVQVPGLADDGRRALGDQFGDLVETDGENVTWRHDVMAGISGEAGDRTDPAEAVSLGALGRKAAAAVLNQPLPATARLILRPSVAAKIIERSQGMVRASDIRAIALLWRMGEIVHAAGEIVIRFLTGGRLIRVLARINSAGAMEVSGIQATDKEAAP